MIGNVDNQVLLIDKPSGMTSHDVVNLMRHKTGVKRIGHAGTLDPLATGLLIVLVGRSATKRQSEFLKQDKEYLCTAQLGMTTDTYDCDGQITNQTDWLQVSKISQSQIKAAIKTLTGEIKQQVPAFSAVKQKGKKLYQLARRSQIDTTALPIRTITIYEFELLETVKNERKQTIITKVRVKCSCGTYIRSLINDLGRNLGVGAVVLELRRTKIGQYRVENAQELN
jgi:tRNA pseudouridine55 synthase